MRLCPYCGHEATGIGDGSDECLDYCKECLRLVEGETIDEAAMLRGFIEGVIAGLKEDLPNTAATIEAAYFALEEL